MIGREVIIPVWGIVCAKILICKDCIQVTESQQYEYNTLIGGKYGKIAGIIERTLKFTIQAMV